MGKGRRNQRNVDYYKVQGGAVEDRDVSRASKQKLATQERMVGKKPSPEDVHPVRKKKAGPKVKIQVKSTLPKKRAVRSSALPHKMTPRPEPPKNLVGASLSRVGGLTRRVVRAAELAIGALRWAGHTIQVVRGKVHEE
jgi:hypothetical protein